MNKLKPKVETITLLANRDQMHVGLMTKVRLNRYDMKFMANISEKYLVASKPLSPGQNTLYEKIVHKYRKQLKRMKVDYRDILALEWANGIVSAEVLNQKTYFRIAAQDDGITMQLYFNFNKAQIEEVRALVHDDEGNHLNRGTQSNFGNGQKYNFTWDNATKSWYGPFNVYLFKKLYEFAKKSRLRIDRSVLDLITELESYGSQEDWTPSLHLVHDRLYVNQITESMLPYLDKINQTNTALSNIELYTKLGISSPDWVGNISEYVNSASTVPHIMETENDVDVLRDYINQSGRKVLFYMPELSNSARIADALLGLQQCTEWGTDSMHYTDTRHLLGDDPGSIKSIDLLLEEGYDTLVTTTPITNQIRSQSSIGQFALKADKVIYLSLKGNK